MEIENKQQENKVELNQMKNKATKFIPLFELKLYYLMGINDRNTEEHFMWGSPGKEVPTLTGWIKYWRKHNTNQDFKITYKK